MFRIFGYSNYYLVLFTFVTIFQVIFFLGILLILEVIRGVLKLHLIWILNLIVLLSKQNIDVIYVKIYLYLYMWLNNTNNNFYF